MKLHHGRWSLARDAVASSCSSSATRSAVGSPNERVPAKFTVDGEIEECSIPQPMVAVEHEADFPYLLGLKRSLGTELPSCVPGRSLLNWII